MSKNKYCGNCKHFNNEDVEGWGWCSLNKTKTHCAQSWDCHNNIFNGWTEITPDNEHELTDELISKAVIGWLDNYNRQHIVAFEDCVMGIGTMAKYGGYTTMFYPN